MKDKPAFPARILLFLIAVCHWAIIPYALLAWVWPEPIWLIIHLILLPALVVQWWLNDNVCLLNNLETWLRTGRWHDKRDAHQGRWLAGMIERYTGITISEQILNGLIYGLLALSWSLSLTRLLERF